MDLGLKQKSVLVTASTSGIGKAIAEVFLKEGSNLILNGRDKEKILRIMDIYKRSYPEAVIDYFLADLTIQQNVKLFKDYIVDKYPKLDILISNLGNGKPETKNFLDLSEWERLLNVNLISTVGLLEEFIPIFKNQKRGSIVLVSSIAGVERSNAPFAYAAAKASLIGLNKNLSVELAQYNIRINCVIPGNVYFPGGRWEEIDKLNPESTREYIKREVPLNRFATPEEIANSVVFLASDRSSFTTGTSLIIDGGQTRGY